MSRVDHDKASNLLWILIREQSNVPALEDMTELRSIASGWRLLSAHCRASVNMGGAATRG